jgi:hypothetical protein
MSAVVNLNFAIGEPDGRAVWPTSDKEEAEEQPSHDLSAETGLKNESDEEYVDVHHVVHYRSSQPGHSRVGNMGPGTQHDDVWRASSRCSHDGTPLENPTGLNIGDAIEAVANANKALEPVSNDPIIAPLSVELHDILNDLSRRRYGAWTPNLTPLVSATPLPTLIISSP